MKLERAVRCATPMRPGRAPIGMMVLPGIVMGIAVAVATVIMGLHA
jgi:hypothetical protein